MQGESIIQTFSGILFSLIVFFKTLLQTFGVLPAPCEEPLLYRLGEVDPRFGITEAEVLEAAKQAEAIWENTSGKNLFSYSQDGGLPIRLIYDERQQETQAAQELQTRLEKLNLEKSEQQVAEQLALFEKAKADYERKLATYERDVEAYNKRVENINKRGGATESEQDDLAREHDDLQKQFRELEKARQKVNSLVGSANQQITNNQNLVETYNKEITTFQEQYGGEGEVFDQGVYTGDDITIYQYDDKERLILVLAHEMGHALGIEHVEDPEALMHYLMRDQNVSALTLDDADKQALENICKAPAFPWST